ncbi:hypothetical protein MJO28_000272 [Puccinia striiformis f. sp. tritici]|uniref:Uncharacterized protein n=1 Tax=Puccinia striiformis f. sp. tritici TaxID=168172 RepID=A0ACC0EZB4_9BASI|nr:hypothetical protein MJO28_000272 [Puccinia striiformis f. sp. tritici]
MFMEPMMADLSPSQIDKIQHFTNSMANQTQSNKTIKQSTNVSDLDISLHPLPILNISDHFTRTRLQAEREDIHIFGALIGTQIGKKIEVVNCFEILIDVDGKVNDGFLKTRREQFQQVFPTLDLLGWYTNGSEPRERDLMILNEVAESTDLSSPIIIFYNPFSMLTDETSATKELPVHIYEFTQATNTDGGEAFVKCAFDVQTSEAERIAVDCVAKPNVGSKENGLVASLITQKNAIQMLYNKLGLIVDYLAQLMASIESSTTTTASLTPTKIDHGLLREISSLVASLPKPDENVSFRKEYMIESNDALLTSYLSSQSKVLAETNQLIDQYLYLNNRENTNNNNNNNHHQSKFGALSGQSTSHNSLGKSIRIQK